MPLSVGEPLIVNVSPDQLSVKPWGKPVTCAPVAPVVNIKISVMGEFIQTVWSIPGVIVFNGVIVKEVLSEVVPHSLVTASEIVLSPKEDSVVWAGFGNNEFNPAGALVHEYVMESSPQLFTVAVGEIV